MTVAEQATFFQDTVVSELTELRRGQLLKLIIVVPIIGWSYYFFAAIIPWPLSPDGVPLLLVLLVSCGGAFLLRHKHHQGASWSLLTGMILAFSLIAVVHPGSLAVAFAAITIIVASALLGTGQTLLVTLLTALSAVVAVQVGTGNVLLSIGWLAQAFFLYGLVFATTWLSHAPLETAIEWSLSAWGEVHRALLEARERRAAIYRVARALDEATYRIERMNNELIVARHEAEVAKANKARFAATVSHELRGPLNLILGFSRLMVMSPERYGVPLPSAYRQDIDTIYLNSQHLADLIDDVLDLSQIDVAKLPLVRERIDLAEDVVKESVNAVRPLIERKGLYLRVELTGDPQGVLADKVRLRQVMINLLTNAVRFTDRGGITVCTTRDGDSFLVSVRDTGRGIAPEDMTRLFEEFYRAQTAETTMGKGTGLGLAISKYLVELHGGRIWADSTVGMGTTFYFTVPLPDAEAIAYGTVSTGERGALTQLYDTCLIAHPDPTTVRLLARHLEGYRVIGSPDERQILAFIQELHPRAILTTPELSQNIRACLAQTPFHVPVISCPIPSMTQHALNSGMLTYLIKPITPEMAEATMNQLKRDGEMTVLIVDDDPDAVRLLEIMLTSLPRPYRIFKAYDGQQALELMQEIVPDVVFMDLIMPGMDGEETIARMRASERLQGVPVVIISAKDSSERIMTLGMPIEVWGKRSLDIAKGIKCLKALLDVLAPDYLGDSAMLEAFERDPLA